MCVKCKEIVSKHYPNFSPKEQHDILWNATCFPFGSPEDVEKQLVELRTNTDGTLEGAMAYADAQMSKAMAAADTNDEPSAN